MKSIYRTRLVGTLLAIACLVALAACGDSGGGGGGGGAPARSNADLLKEAAANMKALNSYHIEMDVTQGEDSVQMSGDLDFATNNSDVTMTAGGQNIRMVQIGGDSYMSLDGGQTFIKSEGSATSGFESFTELWDEFKPEEIDKAKDALRDGTPATEQIDGVETKHIVADAKDLAALDTGVGTQEGTIEFWVSTGEKPYVHQMKMDGTSDGKPIKGTFKWSKFDEKFDIQAPPTSLQPGVPSVAALTR